MNAPLLFMLAYLAGWFGQRVFTKLYRAAAEKALDTVKAANERADIYTKLYHAAEADLEQARAAAKRARVPHWIIIVDPATWHRYEDLVRTTSTADVRGEG